MRPLSTLEKSAVMSPYSASLIPRLQKIGWFEGRSVAVNPSVPSNHPAYQVLAELSGLRIVRDRTVEIDFQYVTDDDGATVPLASALKTQMIGIGWHHYRHGQFFMTASGHVIGRDLEDDAFWLQGRTIEEAIADASSGKRSRPMLLPNQSEVMLYGEVFRHGNPAVVGPASPELQSR